LLVATLLLAAPLRAQSAPAAATPPHPDTSGLADAVREARRTLQALPQLWAIDPRDLTWLFTDGRAHVVTVRRDDGDRLDPIALPAGTVIANHATDWNGRRVAMVRVPLPRDAQQRTTLLVHEAMHTLQPTQLPGATRTEAGTGGDFLDGEDGRSWLFLELRALAAALRATGDAQRSAVRDALAFRARRDALAHAEERTRLDALDLSEGLPEYTGMRLAGVTATQLADKIGNAAAARVSWVRASGYWTGPAWGYALDALGVRDWRSSAKRGARLPDLAADALRVPRAAVEDTTVTVRRQATYDGTALRAAEHARAVANARVLDSLRMRFAEGAMLRLYPTSMQVAFDPNGQTPLAGRGTVMRGFRWSAKDGSELVADAGALVSSAWDWVQVPLDTNTLGDAVLDTPRTLSGGGWTVTLAKGWRITRRGDLLEARPPQ